MMVSQEVGGGKLRFPPLNLPKFQSPHLAEATEGEAESASDVVGMAGVPVLPVQHEGAVKAADILGLRLRERYSRGPERLFRLIAAARAVGEFRQEPVCSAPVLFGWIRLRASSDGLCVDHLPAWPRNGDRRCQRVRFDAACVSGNGAPSSSFLLDALSDRDLSNSLVMSLGVHDAE